MPATIRVFHTPPLAGRIRLTLKQRNDANLDVGCVLSVVVVQPDGTPELSIATVSLARKADVEQMDRTDMAFVDTYDTPNALAIPMDAVKAAR
jgi:hypothetical protein